MTFKLKTLALAVGLSSSLITLPSYALLITNTVQSSSYLSYNNSLDSDVSAAGSSASSNLSDRVGRTSATGDSTGYSALETHGPSYLDVSRLGLPLDTSASSTLLHTATLTNDSAAAINLDFNFLINSGYLDLGSSYVYTSGDQINAGYTANIRVSGNTLWSSGAQSQLSYGYAPVDGQVSTSGTSLNGVAYGAYYEWGTYNGQINLGTLAAGASLTLEYELNTYVNEHFIHDGYSHTPTALFSDPFDFNSHPLFGADNFVNADTVPSSELPEPSGLLLAGAGLAGLAFRRRLKKAPA